jgi:hypothetical protein
MGVDIRTDLVERLLDQDLIVRWGDVVHLEQRLGDRVGGVAGGDALESRTVDRVHELEQQQGALVPLPLERLDQRVELGYSLVEVHTVSRISGSLSSISPAEPSPHCSLAGSTRRRVHHRETAERTADNKRVVQRDYSGHGLRNPGLDLVAIGQPPSQR